MECQDMLMAEAELWKHMFSFLKSMSIKCAIELGIPDAIHKHGKPMTLSELQCAISLPISSQSYLLRVLRVLTHIGFLDITHNGKNNEAVYDLTRISCLLVNKADSINLSSLVLLVLDFISVKPSFHLSDCLKQDKLDAFEMAHNCAFWELIDKSPEFSELFYNAMACDSSFLSDYLVNENANIFQGISSLVDVAGGRGTVAIKIAKTFPNIKCTVLDMPQVVGDLPTDGAVKFVSGDMFCNIPPADVVLLKWILHDWSDVDCIKILRQCKEAIPSRDAGGKVIIVDIVVGSGDAKSHEAQLLFDMLMMTVTEGKERDEKQWWNLFKVAGFSSYKISASLGVRSIIEVYP